jgi:hypothetical protein
MAYDSLLPNHFRHDSLGDPLTCTGAHNHPGDELAPRYRSRQEDAFALDEIAKELRVANTLKLLELSRQTHRWSWGREDRTLDNLLNEYLP